MVTTDDASLWDAMWSFKDHGKNWDAVYNRKHPPGFRWLHESFGTNWRMIEVQAAIGRIQLRRMAAWSARRTWIANEIRIALAPYASAVRLPVPDKGFTHAYYRQYAYVRPQGLKNGWTRDRIIDECVARGAIVMQGSCSEVYLERAFDNTPWRPALRMPVARELGETSLMFLCHPTLTDEEVARIASVVAEVLAEASC